MSNKPRDPATRFWAKVEIVSNSCWEWQGSKYHNGYGQFFDGKNKICAHRYSYKLVNGEIDQNLKVCHKCDNRGCVNPDHLFLGTQQDNIRDMYTKNRQNNADTSGTLNGRANLSEPQVLEMRELYNKGTQISEIARRFDTSETQTARIVKLQSWKHI
jgi:hypothetical protein